MKIEIYREKHEPDKVLRLKLEGDGVITLCAVDADGEISSGGFLLVISERGLKRCRYVSPDIGLALDEHDRVELDE